MEIVKLANCVLRKLERHVRHRELGDYMRYNFVNFISVLGQTSFIGYAYSLITKLGELARLFFLGNIIRATVMHDMSAL